MKRIVSFLLTLLVLIVVPAGVRAHDMGPSAGAGPVPGSLGTTHFSNSGTPRAQPDFLRGLLLLHNFEYDAARRSFQAAEQLDPGFAMAYWGEALTYTHTLWGEQDLEAARKSLAKLAPTAAARALKAPTARERGYLAAVDLLYGEGDKTVRDARYSVAMGALSRHYPGDLDARALFALSILGLSNGVRNVPNYMRAAAEAQGVLDVDRLHPGALHYLIHSVDDPIHAPLGLSAARRYGQVAPGSEHAQHMSSHIYFALGMWDEAIDANVRSLRLAHAQQDGGYHSLQWLVYAYLQEGKRPEAEQLLRSVAHDVATGPTRDNRGRLAYVRAIWLAETQDAADPELLAPVDSTGIPAIGYFAAYDFARGIAAGGNSREARSALTQLQARVAAARATTTGNVAADWHDVVTSGEIAQADALSQALEGTIQYYDGDHPGGIAKVRAASLSTDGMEFEYGPPWSAKPLDELLGELLLADGQRSDAAAAFEKTLAVYPNRRLARVGLAAAQAKP